MKVLSISPKVLSFLLIFSFLTISIFTSCNKVTEPEKSTTVEATKVIYPDKVKLAAKEFGPKIKVVVKDFNYHLLEMKKIIRFYNQNEPYFQKEWNEIQYGLHDVSNYYFEIYQSGKKVEEDQLQAGEEILAYHKNVIMAASK